jgi:hypothetical protein
MKSQNARKEEEQEDEGEEEELLEGGGERNWDAGKVKRTTPRFFLDSCRR